MFELVLRTMERSVEQRGFLFGVIGKGGSGRKSRSEGHKCESGWENRTVVSEHVGFWSGTKGRSIKNSFKKGKGMQGGKEKAVVRFFAFFFFFSCNH